MGESERYLERKVRKISLGDDNNALIALIGINALLFVFFSLTQVIYQMSDSTVTAFQYQILRWAILPAGLDSLAVAPWTLLTHMFIQTNLIATIVVLLWLWAFGSILQMLSGNRHIIPLYIYGGLAGAVLFIGSSYAVPSFRDQIAYLTLNGSGASVLAMAIAVTTLAPKYRLFRRLNGGIPLWILTAIYVVIDFAGNTPSNLIAHAGGAFAGFFYISAVQKGNDPGKWMHGVYSWFINLFDPDKPRKSHSVKDAVFYKTGDRKPFEKQPIVTQERIDLILDKINQNGYKTLTEEEKAILKKAAEEEF